MWDCRDWLLNWWNGAYLFGFVWSIFGNLEGWGFWEFGVRFFGICFLLFDCETRKTRVV